MSINIILTPMTRNMVYDFLDDLSTGIMESFNRAGLEVEVIVWPSILKPSMKCYDWFRRQYFSPCILSQLREYFNEYISRYYVVGIGYIDGYDKGLNFVFGEAKPSDNVAAVFSRRLDPRFYGERTRYDLYLERLIKELVHEIGHLLGLRHCDNPRCVMNFSNSVLDVDFKSAYFCEECSKKLRTKHVFLDV